MSRFFDSSALKRIRLSMPRVQRRFFAAMTVVLALCTVAVAGDGVKDVAHENAADAKIRVDVENFEALAAGMPTTMRKLGFAPADPPLLDPDETFFPIPITPASAYDNIEPTVVIRGTVQIDHLQKGKSPLAGVVVRLNWCEGKFAYAAYHSGVLIRTPPILQKTCFTDENGVYRFDVLPGYFDLSFSYRHLWGRSAEDIPTGDEGEIVIDHEFPMHDVHGVVHDLSGKPMSDMLVGRARYDTSLDFNADSQENLTSMKKTDANGEFSYDNQQPHQGYLVLDERRQLYGFMKANGRIPEVVVTVAPPQEVSGRLVTAEDGSPLAEYEVKIVPNISFTWLCRDGESEKIDSKYSPLAIIVKTDADGRFHATGLIHHAEYRVLLQRKTPDGLQLPENRKELYQAVVGSFQAGATPKNTLPDISVARDKYFLTGHDMWQITWCGSHGNENLAVRLPEVQRLAKENHRNIVVVFLGFSQLSWHWVNEIFYDDPHVRPISTHFHFLAADAGSITQRNKAEAIMLMNKGFNPAALKEPTLCILNAEGKLLESVSVESLLEEEKQDRHQWLAPEKLIDVLKRNLPTDANH